MEANFNPTTGTAGRRHPALLRGASALLKPQFEVVGNVKDGETLLSEPRGVRPDVIVADITLPVLSGIDVVHELRESGLAAKIVFLTIHPEQPFVEACMVEGALGYVLKSHMRLHLIPAIQAVLAGRPCTCHNWKHPMQPTRRCSHFYRASEP